MPNRRNQCSYFRPVPVINIGSQGNHSARSSAISDKKKSHYILDCIKKLELYVINIFLGSDFGIYVYIVDFKVCICSIYNAVTIGYQTRTGPMGVFPMDDSLCAGAAATLSQSKGLIIVGRELQHNSLFCVRTSRERNSLKLHSKSWKSRPNRATYEPVNPTFS